MGWKCLQLVLKSWPRVMQMLLLPSGQLERQNHKADVQKSLSKAARKFELPGWLAPCDSVHSLNQGHSHWAGSLQGLGAWGPQVEGPRFLKAFSLSHIHLQKAGGNLRKRALGPSFIPYFLFVLCLLSATAKLSVCVAREMTLPCSQVCTSGLLGSFLQTSWELCFHPPTCS